MTNQDAIFLKQLQITYSTTYTVAITERGRITIETSIHRNQKTL